MRLRGRKHDHTSHIHQPRCRFGCGSRGRERKSHAQIVGANERVNFAVVGTGESLNNGTHEVYVARWASDVEYPESRQCVRGTLPDQG